MKKGRFIALVIGAILVAPPIGGIIIEFVGPIADPVDRRLLSIVTLIKDMPLYITFSYLFGLAPALCVGSYGAWIVAKKRPLYIWKAYSLGLILSAINWCIFGNSTNLPALVLLVFTVTSTFAIVYIMVKKLLPWAGTSIIEPRKAGAV